jgi:hypothetical protein
MATPAKRVVLPKPMPEGYLEARLDPVIEGSLSALGRGTDLVNEIMPTLRDLWRVYKRELPKLERDAKGKVTKEGKRQARTDLMQVARLVCKLSQAMEYNSRVTDQLARLRALACGDPDSRTEHEIYVNVTGMGETELVEMMLQAAAQSGKLCPNCTKAALNGRIDAKRIEGPAANDGRGPGSA